MEFDEIKALDAQEMENTNGCIVFDLAMLAYYYRDDIINGFKDGLNDGHK